MKFVDGLKLKLIQEDISLEDRYNTLILLAHNSTDNLEGIMYAEQAYEVASQLDDFILRAGALEELAINYRLLGNAKIAVKHALSALEIYEKNGDVGAQAAILVELGSYGDFIDIKLSLNYLNRAKVLYEENNLNHTSNYTLTILNLGEAYRLSSNLDSAIYYFQKSLSLADSVGDESQKAIIVSYSTGNLGMVYNTLDSLGQARNYLTSAIEMTRELGDPYTTSVYLADLGMVERKEGNYQKAEKNLLEAYEMALDAGLKEQVRDISQMLVAYYEQQGAYQPALEYQQVYQQYQDSLVNKENIQKVEQLKANYEIDKRETEISLLHQINLQQRALAIGLGIGLVVLLGFAFVIYRTNGRLKHSNAELAYQKEEVSKRESEKAWLLRELNHRVKNNLQMITSLLALQESQLKGHPAEAEIAAGKYRVKALSLIHRKLYSEDHHTEILLSDYLQELVKNLCHGFGVKWVPQLDLEAIRVPIDTAVPLALIVNELVNNALKYAFVDESSPELVVWVRQEGSLGVLEVKDNGKGLDPDAVDGQGFGTRLVHSLVRQIEGKLELVAGKGTHWRLEFSVT